MALRKDGSSRRARGDPELGFEKVVIGMRSAIRHLKTSRLSRKDIADFAGVTPPLVSYYFPDRESLVEAATLPVVKAFAEEVNRCVVQAAPPERVLWDLVELIVGVRCRDGALIDAYAKHREAIAVQRSNPLLAVEGMIKSFFDGWLKGKRGGTYHALLSQIALEALCESASHRPDCNQRYQCQFIYQIIMCIVGEAEAAKPVDAAPERIDRGLTVADHALAIEGWSSAIPVRTGEA